MSKLEKLTIPPYTPADCDGPSLARAIPSNRQSVVGWLHVIVIYTIHIHIQYSINIHTHRRVFLNSLGKFASMCFESIRSVRAGGAQRAFGMAHVGICIWRYVFMREIVDEKQANVFESVDGEVSVWVHFPMCVCVYVFDAYIDDRMCEFSLIPRARKGVFENLLTVIAAAAAMERDENLQYFFVFFERALYKRKYLQNILANPPRVCIFLIYSKIFPSYMFSNIYHTYLYIFRADQNYMEKVLNSCATNFIFINRKIYKKFG